MRELLRAAVPLDSDLRALCINHFPKVAREFGDGMIRTTMLNILLNEIHTEEILARLREDFPKETARYEHLIRLGDGRDPLPGSKRDKNEQQMIQKVRQFWIEGVLEKSLRGVVMVELGKEYQPDAVPFPWEMVIDRPDVQTQSIANGKKMVELFDENQREILLLGAPGSGKTTMLLDLCRDLLRRAEEIDSEPIPIIFNLSSWKGKVSAFDQWCIEELLQRYRVPRRTAKEWIRNSRIIFLLDGLDETDESSQDELISEINRFKSDHCIGGLVVCSRSKSYRQLSRKLTLCAAIAINSLTFDQIKEYFTEQAPKSVWHWLSKEKTLLELLKSPLLADIFLRTAQPEIIETLGESSNLENNMQTLMANYVIWSLKRHIRGPRSTMQRTLLSISHIAQIMLQQKQTIFFLENLQPAVLRGMISKVFYHLFVMLSFTALTCIVFLFPQHLLFLQRDWSSLAYFGERPENAIFPIAICAFSAIISVGFNSKTIAPIEEIKLSWTMFTDPLENQWAKRDPILVILTFFITLVCIFGYLHFIEIINKTLGFALYTIVGLIICSIIPVAVWFLYSLAASIAVSDDIPSRDRPNQIIIRSVVYNLLLMAPLFLIYFSIDQLYKNRESGLIAWLGTLFLIPIVTGALSPVVRIVFGGLAACRHYSLRLVLIMTRTLPLRVVSFCEICETYCIMRRIGSGYSFIHRLLLEYLANLTVEDIRRLTEVAVSRRPKQSSLPSFPTS